MSFRTIEIITRCKLEYSLNYLIVRSEETKKINLNEISTLIINSTAVSITSYLICKLSEMNIKLIFCDEKRNPISELIPYFGTYNSYAKLKEQLSISNTAKGEIWRKITIEKIKNQAFNLKEKGKSSEYQKLIDYSNQVELHDITNREGDAAKVYFNSIFYEDFTRTLKCQENKFLNYGYAILLSSINRAISLNGFLNQLGIHHISETNPSI